MAGTRNPIVVKSGSGTCRTTARRIKTGQTVSAADYDDGYYENGRDTDFFHCTIADKVYELYGHTFRFTGKTGGYQSNIDDLYYTKAGVLTDRATAFPDNVIMDWSQFDEATGEFLSYYAAFTNTNYIWTTAMASAVGHTDSLFATGWYLPNVQELMAIVYLGSSTYTLGYPPFNLTIAYHYWTSTYTPSNVGYKFNWYNSFADPGLRRALLSTSSTYRLMAARVCNISELP